MDALGALFPFLLILAAFWLLIIRPARNRQRSALQLQEQLAPGLEVMTTSGIFGRVAAVADDRVTLEVAPGVTMAFAKAAVGRILTEPAPSAMNDDADAADDGPGERPV